MEETLSREDTFITDMIKAFREVIEQFHLQMVSGPEFDMTSLGRRGDMLFPIPEKNGLSKACSGGNQGLVALFDLAGIQNFKVPLLQDGDSVSVGNQVIDHLNLFEREDLLKRLDLYPPRKVRGDDHFFSDGARNAEAGSGDPSPAPQEIDEDILQSLIIFA